MIPKCNFTCQQVSFSWNQLSQLKGVRGSSGLELCTQWLFSTAFSSPQSAEETLCSPWPFWWFPTDGSAFPFPFGSVRMILTWKKDIFSFIQKSDIKKAAEIQYCFKNALMWGFKMIPLLICLAPLPQNCYDPSLGNWDKGHTVWKAGIFSTVSNIR